MRSDELTESCKCRVLRVDREGEAEITCGVLVPDIGEGRIWERGETFKRGVHLRACAFKEDTTARDEERVAREDGPDGRRRCVRGAVGHVVADRVLCVAGRCEAPAKTLMGQRRAKLWIYCEERDVLDIECVADGELIVAFD